MKSKISISDCRKAIRIAGGISLTMRDEYLRDQQMLITEVATKGSRWVSGDLRFTRAGRELLTERARAILAEGKRTRIPPAPPKRSIRECQKAIEIAGGIHLTMRGEQLRITEVETRGNSCWVSGDLRFTLKEQELLTEAGPGHCRQRADRR